MRIVPLTLDIANRLVKNLHRHHKPMPGCKFAIGIKDGYGDVLGAAICGRPVSRELDQSMIIEVCRLVTDGTPNACSKLYGACARIAKEMGYYYIQTYILESEPGTSLKAAGWILDGVTSGGDWNHSKTREGKRSTAQPMCRKLRYVKQLNPPPEWGL